MNAGSVQTPGPDEQSMFKRAGAWALLLLRSITALTVFLASTPYRVNGPSMGSILMHGDYVLANRMSARGSFLRGDIVVLRSPRDGRSTYVKRIVGMPNETVRLDSGRVYVDDEATAEPYLNANVRTEPKTGVTEWFLDPDEYFVLGDSRADSDDSRGYGPVKQEAILGKVWFRYWPLRRFGIVRNR